MAADQQQLPAAFNQFIALMNREEAKDLVRSINMFMKEFKQRPQNAEADSAAVQSFLQQMEAAMAKHPLFASSTPVEQDAATEALEKYLMTKLHERTFRAAPADVERDDSLAVRCAALGGFVRPAHLEIPDGLVDEEAAGRAGAELNRINAYKAPRDKMVCILNCCRMINSLLAANTSKAEGIGADDFTPLLIYVVIRAQTPQLASNLAYIERYRHHAKLSSETQYYYIQLCGAATFIEMIDATSLKVDRDEFIAHMLAAGAMTDEQLASLQSSDSREVAAAAAAAAADSAAWPPQAAAAGADGGTQQQVRAALEVPLQMQALPSHQQQAAAAAPVYPGLLELEAAGAALLSLRGDAASAEAMVGRHPYCCSALDSLSMRDVGQLLAAYKELVLRYECLAAALEHAAAQQQPPNGAGSGSSSSSSSRGQEQQQHAEVQHAPAVLSPIAPSSLPAAVDALQVQAAEPQQQPPPAVAPPQPPPLGASAAGTAAAAAAAAAPSPPPGQQLGSTNSEVDDLLSSLLAADGSGDAQAQPQQQQLTPEPQGQQPPVSAAPPAAAASADDDMFAGMFVTGSVPPASTNSAAASLLD